jgi:hypothetical protein
MEREVGKMYETARQMINEQFGSINKIAKYIGCEAGDLYAGFKGTKTLYPKYRRLIAEALGKNVKDVFPNETIVEICPYCGRKMEREVEHDRKGTDQAKGA